MTETEEEFLHIVLFLSFLKKTKQNKTIIYIIIDIDEFIYMFEQEGCPFLYSHKG